jgi:hypothetical protein
VSFVKRAAVALSATTMMITGAVMVAPAAQARTSDCVQYIKDRGYTATPARIDACATGSGDEWFAQPLCIAGLEGSGIRESVAVTACRLARA